MKRIFPVIIVLITLSLLGLIVLQISWFRDMTKLRQAQLWQRAEEAGTQVAVELSRQASSAPYMKIPRKPNLSLMPEDFGIGYSRPTISQHYSDFEINEKLLKAFEQKGLEDVHFEFAITSNSSMHSLEMQSPNFLKEVDDTVYNKRVFVAIVPETGSMMEGLVPFEHLVLIIPDLKNQVWKSMVWMIHRRAGFHFYNRYRIWCDCAGASPPEKA
jgi:two-component system phosphate regulon sensor histidine kinase PhoR